MVEIVKQSAWTFDTSSSGGLGVEFFVAEGGMIYLKDQTGAPAAFRYGAAGAGLSAGFKLPKIGKIEIPIKGKGVGGAIAPASFPNAGILYVLDGCPGGELTRQAVTGVCMFIEAAGGLIVGYSGMAMVFGMSPAWLAAVAAANAAGPLGIPAQMMLQQKLMATATGILLTRGWNVGVQGGGGVGAYLGGLW